MKVFLFITLAFFAFVACDIVEEPYLKGDGGPIGNDKNQNILIFEYTGYYCGFCPSAKVISKNLEKIYQDRVFVISIHSGALANIRPENPLNLLSPTSDAIYQFVGRPDNPRGSVNMSTNTNNTKIFNPNDWEPVIRELIERTSPLDIELSANYNPTTREITADVDMTYYTTSPNSHYLAVYVIEDNIVGYQKNYAVEPQDVYDYEHYAVMRTSMNGPWGEQISEQQIRAGSTIERTVKFTIPANRDWVPENLRLVAVVSDSEKEYYTEQVQMTKLIK